MLENVQGKTLSQDDILNLSDRLERLEIRFGFQMLSDIWISSRNEEADVPVLINGVKWNVQVCIKSLTPWATFAF